MSRKTVGIILAIAVIGLGAYLFLTRSSEPEVVPQPIGGDRDEHGCLTPAGYSFSETVGACIREFEMTPDIMQAAKLAVEYVGREYALTVVSFNSYEEAGAYDITLERGAERNKDKVFIRNGAVTELLPELE